jgi:hypothetical protein
MDSFPDSESTQQLSNRFTARQEILKIASLLSSSPPTTHIVVPTLLTIFLFLLFLTDSSSLSLTYLKTWISYIELLINSSPSQLHYTASSSHYRQGTRLTWRETRETPTLDSDSDQPQRTDHKSTKASRPSYFGRPSQNIPQSRVIQFAVVLPPAVNGAWTKNFIAVFVETSVLACVSLCWTRSLQRFIARYFLAVSVYRPGYHTET